MSIPIVDLTEEQRTEILACEFEITRHTERIAQIRREAALDDDVDPTWLAAHS